jgi:hypothetical protein
MHKYFKCLDVSDGRVYILWDDVFDETIYPFSKLNPNTGTRLRADILLVPTHLQTAIVPGDESLDDSCADMPSVFT